MVKAGKIPRGVASYLGCYIEEGNIPMIHDTQTVLLVAIISENPEERDMWYPGAFSVAEYIYNRRIKINFVSWFGC